MKGYQLDLQELPLFRDVSVEEVERFIVSTGASVNIAEDAARAADRLSAAAGRVLQQ